MRIRNELNREFVCLKVRERNERVAKGRKYEFIIRTERVKQASE